MPHRVTAELCRCRCNDSRATGSIEGLSAFDLDSPHLPFSEQPILALSSSALPLFHDNTLIMVEGLLYWPVKADVGPRRVSLVSKRLVEIPKSKTVHSSVKLQSQIAKPSDDVSTAFE